MPVFQQLCLRFLKFKAIAEHKFISVGNMPLG